MSKRIQCEKCSTAEYGESLWIYRGKQYCSICACDEMSNRGEDIGIGDFCNDTTRKHKQKDHRIAELEKENEEKEDKILDLKSYNSDLKEIISKLSFSAVRCQAINDEICQYILDNELLKKENAELKSRVEELECQYSYECGCNAELVTTQQENAELKKLIENCQDEYDLQQFLKEENNGLARKNAELQQENAELKAKLEKMEEVKGEER